MNWVNLLGLAAGGLTTLAFVPQVLKTFHSKSARDVSLLMFSVLCVGVTLWVVYGLQIGSWPVILANGITLVLGAMMLAMKLRYDVFRGGK